MNRRSDFTYSGSQDIKQLAGLVVTGWSIEDDRTLFIIAGMRDGKDERYALIIEGDCCSTSWIEDVFEESCLMGQEILVAEKLDLSIPFNGLPCSRCDAAHTAALDEDGNVIDANDHDSLQYYGIAIYTRTGRFSIDYRNDSNGYYGADITIGKGR